MTDKRTPSKGKLAFRRRRYGSKIDPEVVDLCDAMNACPGIKTFESCSGHGKLPFMVFFYATEADGLFFLTRCSDRRYWKYGHRWTIHLSVGDDMARADGRKRRRMGIDPVKPGDILPTVHCLQSIGWYGSRMHRTLGDKACQQAQSLVDNMLLHLSSGFMEYYGLDMGRFSLRGTK